VLRDAIRLAKASGLRERLQLKKSIVHEASASFLQALGGDASTQDGLNPYFICVDEMHAMRSRDLLDVMESALGAQAVVPVLPDHDGRRRPGERVRRSARLRVRILDGTLEDDDSTVAFFAFIAHADVDDDPWDERTWHQGQPALGHLDQPRGVPKIAAKAKKMPAAAAEFKQKRLNLWVNSYEPWLSIEGWTRGRPTSRASLPRGARRRAVLHRHRPQFEDRPLRVSALFPPAAIRGWCVDLSRRSRRRTRSRFGSIAIARRTHVWVDQGWLETTPGNRIDYDAILERVKELATYYDVQAIGVDPWNAGNLITDLQNEGLEVVEVPQTFAHLSGASKDFEGEVLDGLVDANANPVMRWAVGNAVVQRDGKDNIQPIKKKSRGRIDPVVATVIARRLAGVVESAYSGRLPNPRIGPEQGGAGVMVVGVGQSRRC
jgi:phage terminase large subunit-like protein